MDYFAKRRKQAWRLVRLLNIFAANTPGVQAGSRMDVDLDGSGTTMPVDAVLRIDESAGGQSCLKGGRIVGAPELVVLVSPGYYPDTINRESWKLVRESEVKEFVFWEYKYNRIQWTSLVAAVTNAQQQSSPGPTIFQETSPQSRRHVAIAPLSVRL